MKVNNLYIGDIKIIDDIHRFGYFQEIDHYNTSKIRTTILERIDKPSGVKYKDIIYGGKFEEGVPRFIHVGDEYVTNLSQEELMNKLEGYKRKSISKLKLAKILKRK